MSETCVKQESDVMLSEIQNPKGILLKLHRNPEITHPWPIKAQELITWEASKFHNPPDAAVTGRASVFSLLWPLQAATKDDCYFALLVAFFLLQLLQATLVDYCFVFIMFAAASTGWLLFSPLVVRLLFFPSWHTTWLTACFLLADVIGCKG